ncbi:MAG: hypothetical protein FJX23_08050 [Alphaproteobacteria bacterium]|nr:hypothetical protein [Alphaproteobacteria bacterium]
MSNKKWVPVVIIGSVVAVGYVGAVTVAKNKIREVVDANLGQAEARIEARGQEATITYKDVSVHGFSLRPSAVLHGLNVKIVDPQTKNEAIVTTPEVRYVPYNFGMTNYRLEVPQNIELLSLRTNQPREQSIVSYKNETVGGTAFPALDVLGLPGNEHSFQLFLPKSVIITTLTETEKPELAEGATELPAIDAATAKTEHVELVQGEEPYITWKTSAASELIEQKVVLSKVAVNYQYDPFLTADQFTFNLQQTNKDDEAKTQQVASLFKLENLNFNDIPVVNPVNIINDVTYTGPIVVDEAAPLPAGAKFTWDVKEFSFITGLSSIFANGNVTVQPDKERLPYGKVALRLDDLKKLYDHLAATRPAAVAGLTKVRGALERISGANIEAGEVVNIDLVREEGGRLQVGKLSLEEALAVGFEVLVSVPSILSAPELSAPASPLEAAPEALTAPKAEGELVTPLTTEGAAENAAPVAEAPVTEAPAVEAPVTVAPAVETPAVETPAAEEPVVESPAAQ